ncbi:MAG: DegV family protein [Bacilli bacterium]
MRVAIVTDSTADISAQEAAKLGITVVPLQVLFGEQAFRDGVDIKASEFYPMLADHSELPTTSQPSAGTFAEVFENLLHDCDEIIGIFISSSLSGTVRSAETARDLVGGAITVVDSGQAGYALGIVVLEAAALAAEGAAAADILARVSFVQERVRAYFVLDSLEHLRRGGRLSSASAIIGTVLQIKPVLTLRDKKIEIYEKVRTQRRALESMADRFVTDVQGKRRVVAGVIHSAVQAQAEEFRERLQMLTPQAEWRVIELNPVVGVHLGPRVLSLIYFAE